MGLLDLPPGTSILGWPDADDEKPETHGNVALVACLTLAVICMLVFLARLWAKLFRWRSFTVDDGVMMFAMLPSFGLVANSYLAITSFDFDRHLWDIKMSNYPSMLKITFADEFLYIVASGLIKISVLAYLLRLNGGSISRFYRNVVYISIAFAICHVLVFTGELIFNCMPFEETFMVYSANEDRRCVNGGVWPGVRNVLGLTQDFVIVTLAVILSLRSYLHFSQRLAAVGVLALGIGACIVGIGRVGYFTAIYFTTWDWSWLGGQAFLFSSVECLLGILCASLPALSIFFPSLSNTSEPTITTIEDPTTKEPAWRKYSLMESGRKFSVNEAGIKAKDGIKPKDGMKAKEEPKVSLEEMSASDSLLTGNATSWNPSFTFAAYGGRRRSRVQSLANVLIEEDEEEDEEG